MTAGPTMLCRVTSLRLVLERRRVAEALLALRSAEAMLDRCEAALARARVDHVRRAAERRDEPACEQRRFLLAVTAMRLEEAERSAEDARCEVELAQERLRTARQQEQRTDTRHDLVTEQARTIARRAHEVRAEREGEDRWTPAPIA